MQGADLQWLQSRGVHFARSCSLLALQFLPLSSFERVSQQTKKDFRLEFPFKIKQTFGKNWIHCTVKGIIPMEFDLRFSLWLIQYFLKTYVYTPSTPCRDVKFCPNIPLGDLSWNSLIEVMWHHQINSFSNSKFWRNWQENVRVGLENDWSGSFVLLYGWNNEDVRWGFSLFKSIGKLWAILNFATSRENLDCS